MKKENIVTQRFVKVFKSLEEAGKWDDRTVLAHAVDSKPQTFTEILGGRSQVTTQLLQKFCAVYNVNLNYIFFGELPIIKSEENAHLIAHPNAHPNEKKAVVHFKAPEIVTVDNDGHENIVLVDHKAAAGYLTGLKDKEYFKKLPLFRLPGYYGKTYRAFEVTGDSMYNTLWPNDIVICSYVEDSRHLKDNYIYVLVCEDSSIIVKRIINRIEKHQNVIVKSDNAFYPPYKIDAADIREFWFVHAKITAQMPPPDQTEKRLSDLEGRVDNIEAGIKKIN